MPKLKSSEATKIRYWTRKNRNSQLNNHQKRVIEWKAKVARFQNDVRPLIAGAKPMEQESFSMKMWS